jgi:cysteinyl-tRNA synthetase
MSKSLGNFFTIHELLRTTKFGGRKWPGEVLRLAMLRTQYRQPIDWTVNALEEAESTLSRWCEAVGEAEPGGEIAPGVSDALGDDLNTPAALMELHRLAHAATAGMSTAGLTQAGQGPAPSMLKASANLLGLLTQTQSERRAAALNDSSVDAEFVGRIIAERSAARARKDWKESDRLRDRLAELGVAIKDSKDGTTWEPHR